MKLFDTTHNIANEVIDHQRNNSQFKADLIEQLAIIYNKLLDKTYGSNKDILRSSIEITAISDLIHERVGIRLRFIEPNILQHYNAGIYPYYDNAFNPLLSVYSKKGIKTPTDNSKLASYYNMRVMEEIRSEPSVINTAKAHISGPASRTSINMVVDFKGLLTGYKLSPDSLAAVIMHEVGHAFTYLLFNTKLTMINQSLSHLSKSLDGITDKDKAFNIAKSELTSLDSSISDKEIENMFSGNTVLAGTAYVDFIIRNTNINNLSLYLVPTSSDFDSENVADSFATRMGFGPELVVGLSVMFEKSALIERADRLIGIAFIVGSFVTTAIAYGLPLATVVLASKLFDSLLIDTVKDAFSYKFISRVYKTNKQRFAKIYNDEIDRIKVADISNAEKKDSLDKLASIRAMIEMFPEKETLSTKLFHLLYRPAKTRKIFEAQQDVLERLASNDLFVKSIELELLGDRK